MKTTAAEAIQSECTHVHRNAEMKADVPRDVSGIRSTLHDVADDHVIDISRRHFGLLKCRAASGDRELGGADIFEAAPKRSKWSSLTRTITMVFSGEVLSV